MVNQFDDYINKIVPFKFMGQEMKFELSHALFSSFDIDQGSKLLLKLVAKNLKTAKISSIVDIGSGVGVLGIACAKAFSSSSLLMRDRDAMASVFSERNAKKNKLNNFCTETALFLHGIENSKFDLALSNVPAKAGIPVIDRFLQDLPALLSDNGYGAIVVVHPIAEAAIKSLATVEAEIVDTEATKMHTAIIFKKGKAPSCASTESTWKLQERSSFEFWAGKKRCCLKSYWSLPEFDTASFATEIMASLCENAMSGLHTRRALIINPGVGRLACYVKARAKSATIDLCARDKLALLASRANLDGLFPLDLEKIEATKENDVPFPDTLLDHNYDLIAEYCDITPRVDNTPSIWADAQRLLKNGGSFVISSPSSNMERIEKQKPKAFKKMAEKKKKGFSCAFFCYIC